MSMWTAFVERQRANRLALEEFERRRNTTFMVLEPQRKSAMNIYRISTLEGVRYIVARSIEVACTIHKIHSLNSPDAGSYPPIEKIEAIAYDVIIEQGVQETW